MKKGKTVKACSECRETFGHLEGCSHINDSMKRDALLAGKSVEIRPLPKRKPARTG